MGCASISDIQPGTCKVEYEPNIERKISQLQEDIKAELQSLIKIEKAEASNHEQLLSESGAVEKGLIYTGGVMTGAKNVIVGLGSLIGNLIVGAGEGIMAVNDFINKYLLDPLNAPETFREDLAAIKASYEKLRDVSDEDLLVLGVLVNDKESWKILNDFAFDYIDAQHSIEWTETSGEGISSIALTLVSGGIGGTATIMASASSGGRRLIELGKKVKPMFEELMELLKRQQAKGTGSGLHDEEIKTTIALKVKARKTGGKNVDDKVTVYRVDDNDFKPRISDDGTVPVVMTKTGNERALFINIGQPERAKKFALENRKGNATVTAVDVDASLLEDLRKRSIYDKSVEATTNKSAPLKVDINKVPDQYGLRTKEDIDAFRDAIDPSTVRKVDPNDL